MLTGNIFVTGGAGFLARAIYRRAERENWPCSFTAYSRHEDSHTRLHQRFPNVRRVLGDVRNFDRLATAMAGHDIVIHAAALKRVPESESAVLENVEINIQGSVTVAMAARSAAIKTVVGVSTDKAASPLNVYGASKMMMERVFGEADTWGGTRFTMTRYGNVVGSTGSIVPVFRRQLEQDGRVRVTDPDMTRFWLAPDEAVDLILDCIYNAEEYSGSLIVPRPAAMKIGDLARVVAGEAPIEIIGPRPGEKTHETLVSDYEAARTEHVLLGGHERMIIRPSFGQPVAGHMGHAYTSDKPSRWLHLHEMAAMIADAESV